MPLNLTASVLDAQTVKLCPEHFLRSLRAENFQNASELKSKQLRFQTQIVKMRP